MGEPLWWATLLGGSTWGPHKIFAWGTRGVTNWLSPGLKRRVKENSWGLGKARGAPKKVLPLGWGKVS